MVVAVSSDAAAARRCKGEGRSGGSKWHTYHIGRRDVAEIEDQPRCHLTEMGPNQTHRRHFHQTNQFQVMLAGSCTVEGAALPLIALHYADRHVPFGPLTSGPDGLCLF